MEANLTAAEAKSLLEKGSKITVFYPQGWINLEYSESANAGGKMYFWAQVQDDREDGEWERQNSWSDTVSLITNLGGSFIKAIVEE